MGIPELPNEIKSQISQYVWNDEAVVQKEQKEFIGYLYRPGHDETQHLIGNILELPWSKMKRWGITNMYDLNDWYRWHPNYIRGTYITPLGSKVNEEGTPVVVVGANQERVIYEHKPPLFYFDEGAIIKRRPHRWLSQFPS